MVSSLFSKGYLRRREQATKEQTNPPVLSKEQLRVQKIEQALDLWISKIEKSSSGNALSNISFLGENVIDITMAHPSGIAQLYSGRPTPLSNIIREQELLNRVRQKARCVFNEADNISQKYGVCSTYLSVGLARWTENVEENKIKNRYAPILLRQLRLSRSGDDIVFCLEDCLEINPVLLMAFKKLGVVVDSGEIIRLAFSAGGFSPRHCLDRIAEIGHDTFDYFVLEDKLLVAPFTSPSQIIIDDLLTLKKKATSSTIIGALAGIDEDAESLSNVNLSANPIDRKPSQERGVGDLDPVQQDILDNVAQGISLVVNTPPGSDQLGTVVAIMADMALQSKTSLYIPSSSRMGKEVISEFKKHGLDEFVINATSVDNWRSNINAGLKNALSRQIKTYDKAAVNGVRLRLEQTRAQLGEYTARLHKIRHPWNVSAWDALQALTDLTSTSGGPRTCVRFTAEVLAQLSADNCENARKLLARACDLQIFSQRKVDNAWYGAVLTNDDAVDSLLERVKRLGEDLIPTIQRHATMVSADTGLNTANSFQQWEEQIELLQAVAKCLEIFQPQVFENSVADMVIATSSKQWRKDHCINMKMKHRHSLVKQAKSMLRPNVSVDNLNEELIRVQQKRELWKKYAKSDSYPRLPVGLDKIVDVLNGAREDMNAILAILGSAHHDIEEMPFNELISLMLDLASDQNNAYLLPSRVRVLKELHDIGLDNLVEDLRARNVSNDIVASELELAWWASVLGAILLDDKELAGYDGHLLQTLAYQLRQLDKAQVNSLAINARTELNNRSCVFVKDRQNEAIQLYEALDLSSGIQTVHELLSAFPITRIMQPMVVCPAMLVPQILDADYSLDLLVLDNINFMPLAELIPLIARAKQVVVVCDTKTNADCEIAKLTKILPEIVLPTSQGKYNEDLLAFMAKYGYGDLIEPVPVPRESSNVILHKVEAVGIPATGRGAVESSSQEVNRVVDLVIDHALTYPEKSLAVVALNEVHASRIRENVRMVVKGNKAVESFFDDNKDEPFVVTDVSLTAGLHRDNVILTVGYTKTPNGKLLHEFGIVSKTGGQVFLASALECALEKIIVVSSITAQDVTSGYVCSEGGSMLADILSWASKEEKYSELTKEEEEVCQKPDRLLVDLADRLWRLGLRVEANLGGNSRFRIPLAVGHPKLPDEFLVALLTDDAHYVLEPSMRRRERHWIERLQNRGWKVNTVFSTAVFMDPQGQAEEILEIVLAALKTRLEQIEKTKINILEATKKIVAPPQPAPEVSVSTESMEINLNRGPRPPIAQGLPLAAYGDDQLDDLLVWVLSDGVERTEDELVEQLRKALALTRKGAQVDAVLRHVVKRGTSK